ncbi:PAS domain S-box protein [Candidatus Nitrospira bockiana]
MSPGASFWRRLRQVAAGCGPRSQEERRFEQSAHLVEQLAGLLALTRAEVLEGDFPATIRRVAETAARILNVARVGVWFYTDDHRSIQAADIFDARAQRHASGELLPVARYPRYFEALTGGGLIAADDVAQDPRTAEMAEVIHRPLGITSVLDVPIHLLGKVEGVISHQHLGPARRWRGDEQVLAAAVSNLVALAHEQRNRKRAAEAAHRTHSLLQAIVEHIPDMVFVKDAEHLRFIQVNKAAEDLLGYSRDELLGKSDYEFFPKPEADFFTVKDREVLARGELIDIPVEPIQTKWDGRRWLHTKKVPILDDAGKPQYLLGISEDITARRLAEEELRLHSEVLSHMAEGVLLVRVSDETIVYANRTLETMFGYERGGLIGCNVAVLNASTEQSPDERVREIIAALKANGVWKGEICNRKKNGTAFWCFASVSSFDHYEYGPVWLAVYRDITEQKSAQQALDRAQILAGKIIASSLDMIIVVDTRFCVIEFNRAAEESFGYAAAEVLGQSVDRLYAEPAAGLAVMEETIKAGRHVGEVRSRRRDGSLFLSFQSASVLRDPDGTVVGVMSVSRDVTEQKRAVEELRKAKDAAEAASLAKTEFLASMSHEIRTPMNAIIGMADLLWETSLTPEQQEYVGIFRRAGMNLLNLLNDILDLTKVEAGYLELEQVDFDLRDVVDKTAEMMALRAAEKGLELACSVAPDVPVDLVGDPGRLRQILLNLLGNAIKFTGQGEVELRVLPEPGAADAGLLRFIVRDTGIGIPKDKLALVFERFTQADSSTTRRYGGTGLGLTISKRLVELMGGRIWLESEEGRGSTFYFTARFGRQTQLDPRAGHAELDLTGMPVLIADDNAVNRLILREALSSWGAAVTEAADGMSALAALTSRQADRPYRLVLLDCLMPDLSGFDVVERVQERYAAAGTAFMVLTSDSRAQDIAKSYRLGLGGYLVKPIRRSDLKKAIMIALNRPHGLGSAPAYVPPIVAPAGAPLKILLVEDSPDNRLLIRSYLRQANCTVDHADNGQLALELFQAGRYDLVLMDIQMPVMDGYTAAAKIRQWEREQGRAPVPILALTAFGMKDEEGKSMSAGCTAHLTKPIRKATLLAAIAEHARSVV